MVFENEWWVKTDFGFEFFDFCHEPLRKDVYPKVHHFRSSNVTSICTELEKHWGNIIENNTCIPIHKIIYGTDDEFVKITPFLNDNITSGNPSSCTNPSRNMELSNDDESDEEFDDFQYHEDILEKQNFEITPIENLRETKN